MLTVHHKGLWVVDGLVQDVLRETRTAAEHQWSAIRGPMACSLQGLHSPSSYVLLALRYVARTIEQSGSLSELACSTMAPICSRSVCASLSDLAWMVATTKKGPDDGGGWPSWFGPSDMVYLVGAVGCAALGVCPVVFCKELLCVSPSRHWIAGMGCGGGEETTNRPATWVERLGSALCRSPYALPIRRPRLHGFVPGHRPHPHSSQL